MLNCENKSMGVVLKDHVALVTGASRGLGRGIAIQLGKAGATVYITARRPELSKNLKRGLLTLEYVAKEITAQGGKGIPIYVDHSNMTEVKFLFEKIEEDQNGRLDILINNVYNSLNKITDGIGKKFYELEPEYWDAVNDIGLRNHYYCSVYASRLMVKRNSGLIINIGSLGGLKYVYNVPYGVGKEALTRLSTDMALELIEKNVCVISLVPGPVKTEAIENGYFDRNGKLRKSLPASAFFEKGESAEFTGKAIVLFALDPAKMKKTGRTIFTEDLAQKYGFVDEEGMDPQNIRSVKTILESLGKTDIAKFVPTNIKVPKWIIWQSINRF